MLHLYNTLTRRVEVFTPRVPGQVDLFVCGPTVYDHSHAGHAKTYTQFDFIARYLSRTYQVNYLLNITDVDDKIIARANERHIPTAMLADDFTAEFFNDMAWLHNTRVTQVAKATDYIQQIVEQIQQLQAAGAAYQLEDGWYFDLSTRPAYGQLSGRKTLQSGDAVSRIDDNDRKRNPGDFALWKASKPGEPAWDTVLGAGRPGWHIEDTAITAAVFGPQYDIHGGALDLIFPHHEAEIAQMETASGKSPMVQYWLHTGLLQINGAKMAKSAGNYVTIKDLTGQVDYRTLRYFFLSQHYRSNADFTETGLRSAETSRLRIENFYHALGETEENLEQQQAVEALAAAFYARLDDDLNTPDALALLFDFIRTANRAGQRYGSKLRSFFNEINDLFDMFDFEIARAAPATVIDLVRARLAARQAKDWQTADKIRQTLTAQGVTLKDVPDGTDIEILTTGVRQRVS